MRETHGNAYAPWTEAEEKDLKRRHHEGETVDAIAASLGRKPGAIRSRLGPAPLCRSRSRPMRASSSDMMQKPDVDHIDGLSPGHLHRAEDHLAQPALNGRHGHRDLRLSAAALCAASASPIRRRPGFPSRARRSARWSTGCWRCPKARALYLLAPIVRGRKGEYRKELAEYCRRRAFSGVKIDGKFYEIDESPRARQEAQARYRRGGGPRRGAARSRARAPRRQLRDGA